MVKVVRSIENVAQWVAKDARSVAKGARVFAPAPRVRTGARAAGGVGRGWGRGRPGGGGAGELLMGRTDEDSDGNTTRYYLRKMILIQLYDTLVGSTHSFSCIRNMCIDVGLKWQRK